VRPSPPWLGARADARDLVRACHRHSPASAVGPSGVMQQHRPSGGASCGRADKAARRQQRCDAFRRADSYRLRHHGHHGRPGVGEQARCVIARRMFMVGSPNCSIAPIVSARDTGVGARPWPGGSFRRDITGRGDREFRWDGPRGRRAPRLPPRAGRHRRTRATRGSRSRTWSRMYRHAKELNRRRLRVDESSTRPNRGGGSRLPSTRPPPPQPRRAKKRPLHRSGRRSPEGFETARAVCRRIRRKTDSRGLSGSPDLVRASVVATTRGLTLLEHRHGQPRSGRAGRSPPPGAEVEIPTRPSPTMESAGLAIGTPTGTTSDRHGRSTPPGRRAVTGDMEHASVGRSPRCQH